MNLENYYSYTDDTLRFTREQASAFAKNIAGDFNPLHDIETKRFCVPGDLLFAVMVSRFGVSQSMRFDFEGMVTDASIITLNEQVSNKIDLVDQNDKTLMHTQHSGESTNETGFVNALIEKYVQFSGRTFPEILVNLMKKNGVMINPARPLIIYKNMAVHINEFPIGELDLDFTGASLQSEGKKGSVNLEFDLLVNDRVIGHGTKSMVLSGLRPYDQTAIDGIVSNYEKTKQGYKA